MGERGPTRKPTALRVLEGSRSHRPKNRTEPKPRIRADVPKPPRGFDAGGAIVWRKLAPEIHRLGLLTDLDLDIFGAYCLAVATSERAEPGSLTWDRAVARMLTISRRYGFTPSDRASIKGPEVTDAEEAKLDTPVRIGRAR